MLVEANPFSFAKLLPRRTAAYRLETALCDNVGWMSFDLPTHRSPEGCCGRASATGRHKLRCTPLGDVLHAMSVDRVDFMSLDVEGSEMSVLRGHDWAIPISVLLIETGVGGHKDEIIAFLKAKGYALLADFESPTSLNQVFYLPNATWPSKTSRPVGSGASWQGASWPPQQHPVRPRWRDREATLRKLPPMTRPKSSGLLLAAKIVAGLAVAVLACCLGVRKIDRDAREYEADLRRQWQRAQAK